MARLFLRGVSAAALLTFAVASPARAACPVTSTSKAFAKLGDSAEYTLLPGANFENQSAGWNLGGGSVISGSDPLGVGGSGSRSLNVPAKALVVSPAFCIGIQHPTFRLVARRSSGSWATALLKLRWTDSRGNVNTTTLASLDGSTYSSWAATPPEPLATSLPITSSAQSVTGQLVIDPEDSGGAWQIDDIYVDPYRRA